MCHTTEGESFGVGCKRRLDLPHETQGPGLSSSASPDHQQGVGLEVKQPGVEPALMGF